MSRRWTVQKNLDRKCDAAANRLNRISEDIELLLEGQRLLDRLWLEQNQRILPLSDELDRDLKRYFEINEDE